MARAQPEGLSRWTVPLPASPYPLSLAPRGSDPGEGSTRFMGGVMVVMVLSAYLVVVLVVNSGATYLGYLIEGAGRDWEVYAADANAFLTPWGVVAAHLGLACLTLAVWGFYRFLHHRRLEVYVEFIVGVRRDGNTQNRKRREYYY